MTMIDKSDTALIARYFAHRQPVGWRHLDATDPAWPRCVTCTTEPCAVQLTRGAQVRLKYTCGTPECRDMIRAARRRAKLAEIAAMREANKPVPPAIIRKICVCGTAYAHPRSLDVAHCSRLCAGLTRAIRATNELAARDPETEPHHALRWAIRHPEKHLAERRLQAAVRSGRVVRPELCACGGDDVVAHHHSYDRAHWLDVEWLCRPCHNRHHAEERRAQREADAPAN